MKVVIKVDNTPFFYENRSSMFFSLNIRYFNMAINMNRIFEIRGISRINKLKINTEPNDSKYCNGEQVPKMFSVYLSKNGGNLSM